jgi:hypothetical protein
MKITKKQIQKIQRAVRRINEIELNIVRFVTTKVHKSKKHYSRNNKHKNKELCF